MKIRVLIILASIVLLILILSIIWKDTIISDKIHKKQISQNYRFQEIEEFPFCMWYGNEMQAKIYLDQETGIKYLYVWFGMGNGGATLTRLWENGEKNGIIQ